MRIRIVLITAKKSFDGILDVINLEVVFRKDFGSSQTDTHYDKHVLHLILNGAWNISFKQITAMHKATRNYQF